MTGHKNKPTDNSWIKDLPHGWSSEHSWASKTPVWGLRSMEAFCIKNTQPFFLSLHPFSFLMNAPHIRDRWYCVLGATAAAQREGSSTSEPPLSENLASGGSGEGNSSCHDTWLLQKAAPLFQHSDWCGKSPIWALCVSKTPFLTSSYDAAMQNRLLHESLLR